MHRSEQAMPVKLMGRREAKIFEYRSSRGESLDEIEIVADPSALRAISRFLASAAEAMEMRGHEFEHMHFSEEQDALDFGPAEIVVSRP
jgi:hypothetical protein